MARSVMAGSVMIRGNGRQMMVPHARGSDIPGLCRGRQGADQGRGQEQQNEGEAAQHACKIG
ncbi:hypothetical protein [Sinorhizobium terangae]|uniref:Uncharacterized protein n=1 Tax=Sinorhizobium terangae TaxID=110322 RepID=A0A6N7LCC0_SINTE|nr:hypothetical protein [Sinorhizobium terangae]MBB4184107.1 hypothetical protein [Sinorhizobium terangae]MQX14878.1 hypothetical protein [Sinorhizobium terangae]WFU48207.1 hypothetical protein QA637_01945 [Sinorhizobium terangae]